MEPRVSRFEMVGWSRRDEGMGRYERSEAYEDWYTLMEPMTHFASATIMSK